MSEKSEAARSGDRLQRNSGRGPYAKGDALSTYFLVDYKEVEKSFTLNKGVWAKVVSDTMAVDRNRMPALKIILGPPREKIRLAIVEQAVLEEYEEMRASRDRAIEALEDFMVSHAEYKEEISSMLDEMER